MALRSKGTNRAEISSEPLPQKGNGQWNLVVIAVDQFTAARVSLIGIWLLITSPDSDNLTLVPIFPAGEFSSEPNKVAWEEMFSLDTDLRPSSEFLSTLSNHLLWDEFLLIDRQGITNIVDQFEESESTVQANEIQGIDIPSSASKIELNLEGQFEIWRTACRELAAKSNPNEVSNWLDKIKPYTHSQFELNQVFNQLILQENSQFKLKCEFPTLTLNSP